MLRACAYAGIHKSRGTKFCTVTPNTCGLSVWSGFYMCGEFVYPRHHVYIAKAVWLPIAVSLKTCISDVPGSNLGRPSAVLTSLSWFFISFFWTNSGMLYRLCGDCLLPKAGSGPGGTPPRSKGGPAKNLYTKSEKLSVAEWLRFGPKRLICTIMILPRNTKTYAT
jgi:hypothetical protein